MKQKIDPRDILEGDLIRIEGIPGIRKDRATEYRAYKDGDTFGGHRYPTEAVYYLLERPEPPFEPYWGMVIGHPRAAAARAVYLPATLGDMHSWMTCEGEWESSDWAKKKLAEGWVIIEKPEGVK